MGRRRPPEISKGDFRRASPALRSKALGVQTAGTVRLAGVAAGAAHMSGMWTLVCKIPSASVFPCCLSCGCCGMVQVADIFFIYVFTGLRICGTIEPI